MKKTFLITGLLTLFIATSCGNAANKKDENKNTAIATANENKIKPEHLTFETFKEKVWDFEANPNEWIYKGSEPAIIDFYADWCGPCKIIAPIMEELAKEYEGKIKIYKIDTDDERELSGAFGIRSIPTVYFIPVKGRPMMQAGAMQKADYIRIIEENLLNRSEE